jgi:hypothetical protein
MATGLRVCEYIQLSMYCALVDMQSPLISTATILKTFYTQQ